ncbi:Helicase associated domain-containing protein [Streptomyces sp. Ncost-T10-10d]|nr:Helicase associated domain-containing protein [Streptomyces sp. Ncost-T10-10d]
MKGEGGTRIAGAALGLSLMVRHRTRLGPEADGSADQLACCQTPGSPAGTAAVLLQRGREPHGDAVRLGRGGGRGEPPAGRERRRVMGSGGVSGPAEALLKFSTPRDPAALAAFINLRVLNPEHEQWRRGVEAAVIYTHEHGDLRVPFTYRVPEGEGAEGTGWPASLADFPLGQWTADARRFYARGDMGEDRVAQLEKLGMVWSHFDVAWEEGLSAARGWAAEHGRLLAPLDAAHQGYKVGIWLKNARAAARRAQDLEQRKAEGLPVQSRSGALSEERREQLENIAPSWCPTWPVEWQRAFHLTRQHLDEGGTLPTEAGDVVRQGEDLGRWVRAQRLGWEKLTTVQQRMCEHILGITPTTEHEKPKPRTSQADKWAMNYGAAKQFYEREGHLQVPRKHVEKITVSGNGGEDQEPRGIRLKLGAWVENQRSRAATLTPERIEQLSAIGMRWT